MEQSITEKSPQHHSKPLSRFGLSDFAIQRSRFSSARGNISRAESIQENRHTQNALPTGKSRSKEVLDRVSLLNEMRESLQECLSNPQKLSKDCFNSKVIDGLSTYVDFLTEEVEGTRISKFDYNKMSTLIEGASRVYGHRVESLYDLARQMITDIACGQKEPRPTTTSEASPLRRRPAKEIKLNEEATLSAEEKISVTELLEDNKTLDPHFLKVSSLVDEAGVGGLLLTNLQVDAELNLIFDGSSAAFPQIEKTDYTTNYKKHPECDALDTDALKEILAPDGQEVSAIAQWELCPEMRSFEEMYQSNRRTSEFSIPIGNGRYSTLLEEDNKYQYNLETDDNDNPWMHNEATTDLQPDETLKYAITDEDTGFPPLDADENDNCQLMDDEARNAIADPIPRNSISNDVSDFLKLSSTKSTRKAKLPATQKAPKKEFVFDISCVDMSNLSIPIMGFEQMKASHRKRRKNQPLGFLVAQDETSVIFPFKEESLFSLNTIAQRMIQVSRVSTSPKTEENEKYKGTVLDPERKSGRVTVAAVDRSDFECLRTRAEEIGQMDEFDALSAFGEDYQLDALNVNASETYWKFEHSNPNMLPMPFADTAHTTQKNVVSENLLNRFAKSSKYVDVTKLKIAITQAVTPAIEKTDNKMAIQAQPKDFQNIVNNTLDQLPGVERENCSVHMLFVCLLYVCNDKELLLRPFNENSGFVVINDASLEEHVMDDTTADSLRIT